MLSKRAVCHIFTFRFLRFSSLVSATITQFPQSIVKLIASITNRCGICRVSLCLFTFCYKADEISPTCIRSSFFSLSLSLSTDDTNNLNSLCLSIVCFYRNIYNREEEELFHIHSMPSTSPKPQHT